MKKSLFIYSLLAIVILSSCEKNSFNVSNYMDATGEAQLKVNFFSPYRANPTYQIKINDTRVSNIITRYDTPFPGGGLNTGGGSTADYLSVQPGDTKITASRPFVGTSNDSVILSTATVNIEADKKYSVYFSDTAANTKVLLVQDTLARPDSGYAKYKFINLIPDLPAADLYIGTTKVATNIPYQGVSAAFTVPTNSSSTTWSLRATGSSSTSTALTTYASASSINNQRIYTVVARGYNSISASTDPRRRQVSLIYNQ